MNSPTIRERTYEHKNAEKLDVETVETESTAYTCVCVCARQQRHRKAPLEIAVAVFEPQAELTQESDLAAGAIGVRCWGHNETLRQLNLKSAWTIMDGQAPSVCHCVILCGYMLHVTNCYSVTVCYSPFHDHHDH